MYISIRIPYTDLKGVLCMKIKDQLAPTKESLYLMIPRLQHTIYGEEKTSFLVKSEETGYSGGCLELVKVS